MPPLSDTAVLVFSRSAALDASTVTPGKTAPDVSFTTPVSSPAGLSKRDARQQRAGNDHQSIRSRAVRPVLSIGTLLRSRRLVLTHLSVKVKD